MQAEGQPGMARCPRCRYPMEALPETVCPECGVSTLPVRRDGYTLERVRKTAWTAGLVTTLNMAAAMLILLVYWDDGVLFLMGTVCFVGIQTVCFVLTMIQLPGEVSVRADYEARGFVRGGFLVNMAGFAGCLFIVVVSVVGRGIGA